MMVQSYQVVADKERRTTWRAVVRMQPLDEFAGRGAEGAAAAKEPGQWMMVQSYQVVAVEEGWTTWRAVVRIQPLDEFAGWARGKSYT